MAEAAQRTVIFNTKSRIYHHDGCNADRACPSTLSAGRSPTRSSYGRATSWQMYELSVMVDDCDVALTRSVKPPAGISSVLSM